MSFGRNNLLAQIGEALCTSGISVEDRYLAPAQIRALADCALARRARGDFAEARIGADRGVQRRAEIRGDLTCWIAPPLLPPEQVLLDDLEHLRRVLNARALLGLFDLELHYAWYPPGAGYARHIDQPQGRTQRRVSLVLYLNEAWEPASGGELRLFEAVGGHRDIEPIGGRLVSFLTAGREHAVMPARRDRFSISGWLRVRD